MNHKSHSYTDVLLEDIRSQMRAVLGITITDNNKDSKLLEYCVTRLKDKIA